MEAQSLSTCNECGKKFQRKAHLLRHQQQHSGDRPYSCMFCSKTFKRSDVLRDHFSRCDRRGSSAIPSSLERGRKRHACDECSRLKVKCDNNVPCRKCVEFGRKCVKSRPLGATAASSPEESTPSATTPDPSSDRNSIGFLLNCPGETDFLREFPKSTTLSPNNQTSELSNVTTIRNGFAPLPSVYQQYGHMIQENNLDVFLSHLEFQQTFEQETHNWQVIGGNSISSLGPDPRYLDRAALEQRAFDIREKLKHAAATHYFPHLPPKELLQAVELITANNIAEYVQLYFKHWHKHAPMVQEATFNPCTSALPLVLALMCLGGMYSKEPKDVTKLKTMLDTIEGFIYSIPGLSDEYDSPGRQYVKQGENAAPEWQQYQLEELQGAYLMIVLQYWTGNPIARTRVRQQRFNRVVAIFHQLDLPAIQHLTYEIKDQQTFRNWMRKESLIRTAGIAMMLDHAFGILNNFAPRFQWAEIDLPFPCDEVFFKISTYEEMISRSLFPQRKMKVKEAFLNLFSQPESAEGNLTALRAGKLTALDMQMLIHLLYTHVWTQTFSNPLMSLPGTSIPALTAPFKTALRNWKIIWDEIRASKLESEWNKLGFQTTSETYYDAVNAIVGVFEKRDGKFPPFPSDCEKGSHLKRLLSL